MSSPCVLISCFPLEGRPSGKELLLPSLGTSRLSCLRSLFRHECYHPIFLPFPYFVLSLPPAVHSSNLRPFSSFLRHCRHRRKHLCQKQILENQQTLENQHRRCRCSHVHTAPPPSWWAVACKSPAPGCYFYSQEDWRGKSHNHYEKGWQFPCSVWTQHGATSCEVHIWAFLSSWHIGGYLPRLPSSANQDWSCLPCSATVETGNVRCNTLITVLYT